MSATVIATKVNPIHFVEKDLVFNGNQIHYDKALAVDTVKDFQDSKHYVQKWVVGDSIRFQLHGFMLTEINVRLYKCNGEVIGTANIFPVNTLQNYQIANFYYDVLQFEIDSSTIPLNTEFFIELRYLGQGVATTKRYISNPQIVLSELPNSILYKYTNKYNDYNCIYAAVNNPTWSQEFQFRVEGVILVDGQKTKKEVYDDQVMSETVLDAIPYTEYLHKVGIYVGVPDYIAELLNHIAIHTDVEVDGKKYAFGENEWEKNDVENYTLAEYSIKATEPIKQLGRYLGVVQDTTTCFVPSNLVIDVPNNEATFAIAGFNGYGFYYEIREVTFPGPTISATITASGIVYTNKVSFTGLGLTGGNNYAIFIKTICQDGQFSAGISDIFSY